jgi:hypothetical protein
LSLRPRSIAPSSFDRRSGPGCDPTPSTALATAKRLSMIGLDIAKAALEARDKD